MADATSIAAVWTSISSQLPSKYYSAVTLLNSATQLFTHGFNLPLTKLKVPIFEDGEELTSAQILASYVISQSTLNAINIQNVSGGSKTFNALIIAYPLKIKASDVDPGVGGRNWVSRTGAFNTINGDSNLVNTSSIAITGTLPTSPSTGQQIEFYDARGTFGTNALTLARNAQNINGLASDYVCNISMMRWTATFIDATYGWLITF